MAAIGRGDLATYDRIVADDYVAFPATGEEATKAEILASYRSGARKYTNLEIFDVEARVFGEVYLRPAPASASTKSEQSGCRRSSDAGLDELISPRTVC